VPAKPPRTGRRGVLRGPVIASAQERQKLRRRHAVDQSTSVAPPKRPELGNRGGYKPQAVQAAISDRAGIPRKTGNQVTAACREHVTAAYRRDFSKLHVTVHPTTYPVCLPSLFLQAVLFIPVVVWCMVHGTQGKQWTLGDDTDRQRHTAHITRRHYDDIPCTVHVKVGRPRVALIRPRESWRQAARLLRSH
jgi:hypothetical protein